MREDAKNAARETDGNITPAPRQAALIVSAMDEIDPTAATLSSHLNLSVEIAATRAAALRLLGRRRYALVILDQVLADTDPEGSELIWRNAGTAIPLQINFALAASSRLEREVRGALARRERESLLATAAASAAVERDHGFFAGIATRTGGGEYPAARGKSPAHPGGDGRPTAAAVSPNNSARGYHQRVIAGTPQVT